MTGVNTDTSFEQIGLRTVQEMQKRDDKSARLGQEEFLNLMIAQLQNQDPFEPMENGNFLAQMAQFGTVSGIQELQQSFESLSSSLVSNQALQAASLVGRQVLAPTGVGVLEEGGGLQGSVDLPAASPEVSVNIYDQAGQLVRRMELGSQAEGPVPFQWDGLRDDGSYAPPGEYFVSAEASIDGNAEAVETYLVNQVEAVTLGRGGLLLGLKGGGSLDFSEVKQIL